MEKRKAADVETPSQKKAKLNTTKPTPKAPKKGTTTRKGKKTVDNDVAETPTPRVKRINKALNAKVKQIGDFLDSTGREDSRLKRSANSENHVIITEACLLASLMAMHADWQLTEPRMASLLDASEAIVEQYEEKWPSGEQMVRMVVVDLQKETVFEEGIQQKLEGWDLEVSTRSDWYGQERLAKAYLKSVNLLEVELELTEKMFEDTAAFRLFSVAETALRSVDGNNGNMDEATEKAAGSTASELEFEQVKEACKSDTKNDIILGKESGREGVCPAPIKEL